MEQNNSVDEFQKKWREFLVERGHEIGYPKGVGCVLQSRNGSKKRYRWILVVARSKSKMLNRAELEDVSIHLKRAKPLNQMAYAVINFHQPEDKVIVIPAEKVLKTRRILPVKGGIPWDECVGP